MAKADFGENNVNAGPLEDFKEICVDHFLGEDLKSTAFFLSHAHTDHMAGLEKTEFLERLREPGVKLYCHSITPMLLEHFNDYLGGKAGIRKLIASKQLVPMDTDKPTEIYIPSSPTGYTAKVTLLSAGHCPGSVMFLFELKSKRILHTGDCRLSVDDLKKMGPLRDESGKRKPLDQLYIDTTFCTKSADVFPNRQTAFDEAISHVREWTVQGDDSYVRLQFSGRFAHEFILLELYKAFGRKVHVDSVRYKIYQDIPGLQNSVTRNPDTPFHLCRVKDECLSEKQYMTVRLTSMWFTKMDTEDRKPIMMRGKTLSVCYAMHSSLAEIAQMIDYLRPAVVTPLVRPNGSQMHEIHAALRESCSWNFIYRDYYSERRGSTVRLRNDTKVEALPPPAPTTSRLTSQSDEDSDYSSSPKKPKINPLDGAKWNFQFSPSSSKSSGSSRDNSQELAFAVPKPVPSDGSRASQSMEGTVGELDRVTRKLEDYFGASQDDG